MSDLIPDLYRDLLDTAVVVTLATVNPDGQPQLSPVWCSYDGAYVLVNTTVGRQKDKNLRARPFATILAVDPQDPYTYLEVRGEVTERTLDGAVEHISELARTYTGATQYYGDFAPAERANEETRVIYKIKPTRVIATGR